MDKTHIDLVRKVNQSLTEQAHREAELELQAYRKSIDPAERGREFIACDNYYLNCGIDRPMCCGVYLDWVPNRNYPRVLLNHILANDWEFDPSEGICLLLPRLGLNKARDTIKPFYPSWPQCSGDQRYPVPAPKTYTHVGSFSSIHAMAYSNLSLWDLKTEYGQSRLSLLTHLADQWDLYIDPNQLEDETDGF